MVQQLTCRTTGLFQSLDDGLVGLYADLNFCPHCLVRCAGQLRLGLLQVGLGSLKIDRKIKRIAMRNKAGKQMILRFCFVKHILIILLKEASTGLIILLIQKYHRTKSQEEKSLQSSTHPKNL